MGSAHAHRPHSESHAAANDIIFSADGFPIPSFHLYSHVGNVPHNLTSQGSRTDGENPERPWDAHSAEAAWAVLAPPHPTREMGPGRRHTVDELDNAFHAAVRHLKAIRYIAARRSLRHDIGPSVRERTMAAFRRLDLKIATLTRLRLRRTIGDGLPPLKRGAVDTGAAVTEVEDASGAALP
ncbi:hypothetical protein B0H11DRAFT_2265234 [Mycena galericulata]|nr:hypothetical protein B0H11DRAFT_2265234 [Mycena galericulata]